MRKILSRKLVLIFVITLVATYISLPKSFSLFGKNLYRSDLNLKIGKLEIKRNFDLHLGLDLAGGSHLVFEADMSKIGSDRKKDALESLRNTIEKRVNLFGVGEPNVQTAQFENKDRIIVELPGITDTKQAISLIGQTAQLGFAEVDNNKLKPTDLTGADLKSAQVVFDQKTGKPGISLQFTDEGGKKFADITGRNIGKPVVIVLDNNIVSQPTVEEKIVGGQAQITGAFTVEEAKKLAIDLNAGALPVPIKLIEERTVGATLGQLSVSQSVMAGVAGISIVCLFMILTYGWFGLIADIGIFIFAVVTLSLYKLIPVTLTLPGIAGFMLSVGMATDSNILIFERFKEEKLQRPLFDALEAAFGRAWNSIRDAYIATLITCFVLANPLDWNFLNTSGPVRGFAITLAMGIFISLFTGIFVSRNLLRVFIKERATK